MYSKLIKFVVLLSLLVCCGFAGRVVYSCLFSLAAQGKDQRYIVKEEKGREKENEKFTKFNVKYSD